MTSVRTQPPRVSIVTTVLRADPHLFAAAARSVAAQTWRNFEWIVQECPPHGCVAEILAAANVPNVRHVRSPTHLSLAAGRNLAVAEAAADLIAILDADDECDPERLARQVAYLDRQPQVDVLGGALQVIDQAGRELGFRSHPTGHATILRTMRRSNAIAHPTVMMRRAAFEAVGGYRDYGEGACDDYELWARMLQAGHTFANLPEVLLRYRVHVGATKAQRLHATLRDTLRVKRDYWQAGQSFGDRLRCVGERMLLHLPPALVMRCFLRANLRSKPTEVGRT